MLLLLMGALAAHAQPVAAQPAPDPCVQTLCGADRLAPFFQRLRDARDRPVNILQIGDSHTAGDSVTNGLRSELQRRFGNGGRGMMAPGRPYPRVPTWNVTAAHSDGWTLTGLLDSATPAVPLGLSGFTQSTAATGQTMTITADDEGQLFTAFRVCALTRPDAGAVRLSLDGRAVDWSLAAPSGAHCRTIDSPTPATTARLETLDDRPVAITSVATMRGRRGVLLSNLGVISAQISHLGRTDDRVVGREMTTVAPDLVILAYGTNEAYREDLTRRDYEAGLAAQVARIRRLAGRNVPILLIGPPDTGRRRPAAASLTCADGVSTPLLLSPVRESQRRFARENGLAFWDWDRAMGGRCSHQNWVAQDLMRRDLVHFNRYGGDRIGRMLFSDLARAGIRYDPRWGGPTEALTPPPPEESAG